MTSILPTDEVGRVQYAGTPTGKEPYIGEPKGKAIVSPPGTATGGDFTDFQKAFDYVNSVGGGEVLGKVGSHVHDTSDLVQYSNVHLVGEDTENTIIDFNGSAYSLKMVGTAKSDTGTIGFANGDKTVTGTSTQFQTDGVTEGDTLSSFGVLYEVESVASETSLEITEAYTGATSSGYLFIIYGGKSGASVRNLTIKDSISHGINIQNAQTILLDRLIIDNCGDAANEGGIFLDGALYNIEISNSIIRNCYNGIQLGVYDTPVGVDLSDKVISIRDNGVYNNDHAGIVSTFFTGVAMRGNTVASNGDDGIWIRGGHRVQVSDNICSSNTDSGILIEGMAPGLQQGVAPVTNSIFTDNRCKYNGVAGIFVYNKSEIFEGGDVVSKNVIKGNTCSENAYGIEVVGYTSTEA